MRHPASIAALALLLALGACKADEKQQGAGKVEGETLPGSASDAMLPLDTVRSQPPLAPKAPAAKDDAKAGATEAAEAAAPAND